MPALIIGLRVEAGPGDEMSVTVTVCDDVHILYIIVFDCISFT